MSFTSLYITGLIFQCLVFQFVNSQTGIIETIQEVIVPPTIEQDGSQKFSFKFKTSNDIEREENGYESSDTDDGLVVTGHYSYIRPDGVKETVNYIADKNGFRILPSVGLRIAPAALASLAG